MKLPLAFALLATCAPIFAAHAQPEVTDDAQTDAPAVAANGAMPMAPQVTPAVDAYRWKFAPPLGSRWTMRSFTRTQVAETMPALAGQPSHKLEIGGFTKLVADYDVINRDAFGASTIRVTYRQLTLDNKITIDGKVMDVSASKQGDVEGINGASYTIKQAPDGKVWGIDGLDKVQDKILKASTEADPATRAMLTKLMKSLFSADVLRKTTNASTDSWPKYPVRAGESWTYAFDAPADLPMQLSMESRRTLKSLDADIASVDETGNYDQGSIKLNLPMGGDAQMSLQVNDLKGTIGGYTRVQRSSGIALQTLINQTMTGTFMIKMPNPAGGAPIDARVPAKVLVNINTVMEPRG